jgi:hypothetical protein
MKKIHNSNTIFEKFEYFDDKQDPQLEVSLDKISPQELLLQQTKSLQDIQGVRRIEAKNVKDQGDKFYVDGKLEKAVECYTKTFELSRGNLFVLTNRA